MKELLQLVIKESLLDTVKLIPFLFVTYLIMEWLEKKTAGKQEAILRKYEKLGPLAGGVLGVVPQCGFSLMASNLYSGGVIGVGVLIAVFMSTSDEMLPIMISNSVGMETIIKILLTKLLVAVVTGYVVMLVAPHHDNGYNHENGHHHDNGSHHDKWNNSSNVHAYDVNHNLDNVHAHDVNHNLDNVHAHDVSHNPDNVHAHYVNHNPDNVHAHDVSHNPDNVHAHYVNHNSDNVRREKNIHEVCQQEHCDCEDGIWKSALNHTAKITIFIFVFTLVIGFAVKIIGEDVIATLFNDIPVLGEAIAAIVGLIPNCAASVIITELYLQGVLSAGAMMSGLLVSAGIGILVLFRINKHRLAENLKVVGTLYVSGVIWGVIVNLLGITF
jgi:hypothetical protein